MASSRFVEAKGVESKAMEPATEAERSARIWIQDITRRRNDVALHAVDGQTLRLLAEHHR
jgi:hypothetical protein